MLIQFTLLMLLLLRRAVIIVYSLWFHGHQSWPVPAQPGLAQVTIFSNDRAPLDASCTGRAKLGKYLVCKTTGPIVMSRLSLGLTQLSS